MENESAGTIRNHYFNQPQWLAFLVNSQFQYHVMGRGLGKTAGILAPRSRDCISRMPGSKGAFVAATFQQMLSRTLPSLKNGWAKLGLIENVHYVIGRRPPKHWPTPDEAPDDYRNFISFFNGSGVQLISQDGVGSSNGLNLEWVASDEAKYINYEQFQEETWLAVRANRAKFGHLSCWRSLTFTTSMPTVADAKWILKMEKHMNPAKIETILAVNRKVIELEQSLKTAAKSYHKGIFREIKKYNQYLNDLRKGTTYYSEASTLDNIDVLGDEYIRDLKRTLPEFMYNAEVLNIRPDVVEGGFYPALDVNKHTYTSYDNNKLLDVGYDYAQLSALGCKQDTDVMPNQPLYIGVDWGSKINCVSTVQKVGREVRFLSGMHVKHPDILDDLAKKWCEYYSAHPHKTVFFAFDHTGHANVANSQLTYAEQFAKILRSYKWNVRVIGKRRAPTHQVKYLVWNRILAEGDGRLPYVRFNRHNCNELLISMMNAPAKDGPKGLEKDKRSEGNKNIPQEEATHYSDTADIVLDAVAGDLLQDNPHFVDILSA